MTSLPRLYLMRAPFLLNVRLLGSDVVVLDPLVIPWGYVLASYLRRPGDPWRRASSAIPAADLSM